MDNKKVNKIEIILIICGIILFLIFIIITKIINNISTKENFIGTIGTLTLVPTFIGMLIYGIRIKESKLNLSRVLIFISLVYLVGLFGSIINGLLIH